MKRFLQISLIASIACVFQMAKAQKLYEDVLLYVPFNDSISDYSSYQTNIFSSAYDPDTTIDRYGKSAAALQFDGDSSWIELDSQVHLQPSFPFSYIAWVYLDSFQQNNSPIYYSNNYANVYAGASFNISPTGALNATTGNGLGAAPQSRRTAVSTSTLSLQTWHQVAVVFLDFDSMQFFLDGTEIGLSYSGSSAFMAYNNEPTLIGGADNPFVGRSSFPGKIDDLFVIDAAIDSMGLTLLNSLVLSLPMDGNGIDYASASNDGQLNNVIATKDRFGNDNSALNFNGQNSTFIIPDDSNYKIQFPFSLSFWFRPDSFESWPLFYNNSHDFQNYKGVWSNNVTAGGLSTSYGNNVNSGPGGRYTIRNDDPLAANFWHHYVAIFEDSRTLSIYVDGSRDTTVTISGSASTIFYNNAPAEIGFYKSPFAGGSIDYYRGNMDELNLWNTALDSNQVKILFQPGIYVNQDPSDIIDSVGNSVQFEVEFIGTGSDIQYQWQFNDGSTWQNIANSNSNSLILPSITFSDSGLYRCIAENFQIADTSNSAKLTVLENTVGFEEIIRRSSPKIYPNPANDLLYIKHDLEIEELEIINSLGESMLFQKGMNKDYIEIASLESGVYFLKIWDKNGHFHLRWIKL